jgi:putative ABC transport system permease protein
VTAGTLETPRPAAPHPDVPATSGRGRAGWRPALRIARRTIRRNLGRSLLIAALVAAPVAGATVVDGLYRTFSSPERDAYRGIADGDALVEITPFESFESDYYPMPWGGAWSDDWDRRDPNQVDIAALLPVGTELVPAPATYYGVRVVRDDGTIRVEGKSAELGHPLTAHRARLVSGEWPVEADEVLVSAPLADRVNLLDGGRLRAGATITLHAGPTLTVTGIGIDPFLTHSEQIFAAPGSAADQHFTADGAVGDGGGMWVHDSGIAYIATFPGGTDVDALWPELANLGVRVVPRAAFLDSEHYLPWDHVATLYVDPDVLAGIGLTAMVVGLGLLEVILLAGAAFAVGARRQIRDLGLVASNGGTARQIRRIVRAQGLLLGVLGAAIGLVAGLAFTVLGKPLWERFSLSLIDEWRFGPGELAIAAAVGLFSGLAAAIVPARGAARLRPVDALAQRFRTTPLEARLPRAGIVLFVVGSLGALLTSRVAAGDLADYSRQIEEAAGTGVWIPEPPNVIVYVTVQLFGAVLAVAGLIMIISPLIAYAARRLRGWPLAARYAARDAARHRHRTAPAVAAIMIVVAGATGLSIGLQGVMRVAELRYAPSLPENVLRVSDPDAADAFLANAETIAGALPGSRVVPSEVPVAAQSPWGIEPMHLWPSDDWYASCAGSACEVAGGVVRIAAGDAYEVLLGSPPTPAIRATLDAGGLVVLSPAVLQSDDSVRLVSWDAAGQEVVHGEVPATVVDYDGAFYTELPVGFMSAETAARYGLEVHLDGAYISFDPSATDDEIDTALDAADRYGYWADVERGCQWCGVPIGAVIALIGGAALVTTVGVGVTVALTAAEGRADLATMAAVGAPPRRRRAIAAWQAVVVGGLGTLLGLGLGAYYAYLIWPAIGAPEFLLPWRTIAVIGIAVPMLAVLIATAFTPGRLPMIRRIE